MKVYFICFPHGPADRAGYEHQIIALAEGFQELGIDYYGNVNYWRTGWQEDRFLIRELNPVDLNDFDVVIFSSWIYDYCRTDLLPKGLFDVKRKYKLIFIDASDGLLTPGYLKQIRQVDHVLKSHFCNKYKYPSNFSPWQFGLTRRIIEAVNPLLTSEKKKVTLSNFRVPHQGRSLAESRCMGYFYKYYPQDFTIDNMDDNNFSGKDLLYWKQTGRRHNPNFYKRLGESMIVNATGGYFQTKYSGAKGPVSRFIDLFDKKYQFLSYDRIYQFDSWRFWESLASGSCTVHFEFEKYGMNIPVLPVNKTHYLGINLNDCSKVDKILSDETRISEISQKGRSWALDNYSPVAVAKRLLDLIC